MSHYLAAKLGEEAVSLERIIDAAHCLRVKDRARLEGIVDDWERRFPQLLITVYLGVLPSSVTAGEAASWLLENGLRQSPQGIRNAAWAVVWVIDPAAHTLAISTGRSLAAFLPQAALEEWLRSNRFHFWHGEYVEGVSAMLELMGKVLRSTASPRRRQVTTPPRAHLGAHPVSQASAKAAVNKKSPQPSEKLW
jgi:hypothetical protein